MNTINEVVQLLPHLLLCIVPDKNLLQSLSVSSNVLSFLWVA